VQPDQPAQHDLRAFLSSIDPKARDDLRRVLIRDDADRDATAMQLMRFRDENGQGWAEIIDFLTISRAARRLVERDRERPTTPGRNGQGADPYP
jgi:hypothetical protein